jgi:hypothetical protein
MTLQANYEHSNEDNANTFPSKSKTPIILLPPIFILCEGCYWCATYFDKTRLYKGQDTNGSNKCPQCSTDNLSSFPILSNESFTFNYSIKRGVELEFMPRTGNKPRNNDRQQ